MPLIDITAILDSDSYSDDFKETLEDMDQDDDGQITEREITLSSADLLNELSKVAHTNGEWSIVREIALIRGTYQSLINGEMKGTAPGEGGRFSLMVDSLMDRGYSENAARAIAVKIGQSKYAWMR